MTDVKDRNVIMKPQLEKTLLSDSMMILTAKVRMCACVCECVRAIAW